MREKIEKIIGEMRPYIQMHGGDVVLLEVKDNVVKIKVSGACVGCGFADETFNGMIGGMIKEEMPEVKEIIISN